MKKNINNETDMMDSDPIPNDKDSRNHPEIFMGIMGFRYNTTWSPARWEHSHYRHLTYTTIDISRAFNDVKKAIAADAVEEQQKMLREALLPALGITTAIIYDSESFPTSSSYLTIDN